jgi:photosystem II stability/assembly factor-like uncharacterized protein
VNLATRIALAVAVLINSAQAQRPNTWTAIGPYNGTIFTFRGDPFDSRVVYAGTYFGGLYRSADRGYTWSQVISPFSSYAVFSISFDSNHRGTIYVGTFQHGVFKSEDNARTWISASSGIDQLDIQDVAVDPFNSQHLIASTGSYVFVSSDAAASWRPIPADKVQSGRVALFDASTRDKLYIGTFARGVMVSTDGGSTFSQFGAGIDDKTVFALSIASGDFGGMYAATSDGCYFLRNASAEWQDITGTLRRNNINQVLPNPSQAGTLLAATRDGVFKRDMLKDADWISVIATEARLLYADPTSSLVYLASPHAGLYVSVDGGSEFLPRFDGIQNLFMEEMNAVAAEGRSYLLGGTDIGLVTLDPNAGWKRNPDFAQTIFEIRPHPTEPQTLFVGTELNGVYKTNNFGADWTRISNGLVPSRVPVLGQSPYLGNALYAGTNAGIYVSRDSGATWTLGSAQAGVYSLAFDPNRQSTVFFGAGRGQVYKTVDEGYSYVPLPLRLPLQDVLALSMSSDTRLYAVLADGSLWVTGDDGFNWFQIATEVPPPILSVAVDPSDPTRVYIGSAGDGVYLYSTASASATRFGDGLAGAFVFSLLPASGTIFAGTGTGVFKSGADGAWQRASDGLPSEFILRLVPDASSSNSLYALLRDSGVYHTTDANSWTAAGAGINGRATALASHPSDPTRVYAGTELQGIFGSDDHAASWKASNSGISLFIRAIAINPADPNTMYAGSLSAGLFKTTNGGNAWTNIGLTDRNIFKLAIDPKNPSTLYSAGSIGVSRSRDGGATWTDLGQRTTAIFAMAVRSSNPNTIYIGTTNGTVFKSQDAGITWQSASSGLPPANILALAADPNSETIYAGAERYGIWKSKDGGRTWSATGHVDGFTVTPVTSIVVAADSSAVYASGDSVGMFVSTDGGETWQNAIAGIPTLEILRLAADPNRPGTIYACTRGQGVFRSMDAGAAWTGISPARTCYSVAIAPDDSNTLYLGVEDGLLRSSDGGVSWQHAGSDLPAAISNLNAQTGGNVFATSLDGRIYKSESAGANWTLLNSGMGDTPVRDLAQGVAPGSIYVATLGLGFIRSLDGGSTWSAPATPATVLPVTLNILIDPQNTRVLYAGTAGGGVVKSVDGGDQWQPASNGMDSFFVLSLAIDLVDHNTVYAGTAQGGVFVTTDGGAHWTPLRDGLFNNNVPSVVVDPVDHNIVYAGTEGGGVFRLSRK